MPAGVLIGLGVSAFGSYMANRSRNKNAERAAQIQQEGGDRALDFQREQYERNQRLLAPSLAAYQGSMARLNERVGVPYIGPQGPVQAGDVLSGRVPLSSFYQPADRPELAEPRYPTPGGESTGRMALPRSEAPMPSMSATRAPAQSLNSAFLTRTPTAPTVGGTVMLRAPDGETRQFQTGDPRVRYFLSRGAQQVGG